MRRWLRSATVSSGAGACEEPIDLSISITRRATVSASCSYRSPAGPTLRRGCAAASIVTMDRFPILRCNSINFGVARTAPGAGSASWRASSLVLFLFKRTRDVAGGYFRDPGLNKDVPGLDAHVKLHQHRHGAVERCAPGRRIASSPGL
jgi:hypothetical protein